MSWDHPRGCGAHRIMSSMSLPWAGSSPRVRGSRISFCTSKIVIGIIPAGAGLTCSKNFKVYIWRDHPRGCGAHRTSVPMSFVTVGSSPRVRGSLIDVVMRLTDHGIIPAGAGLTPSTAGLAPGCRDHPRGCGAHLFDSFTVTARPGSSPRVRGSPRRAGWRADDDGIIPAGAGLTRQISLMHWPSRDHPRGCGAHIFRYLLYKWTLGSSPRVRGSLLSLCYKEHDKGIIPAGAGLTLRP